MKRETLDFLRCPYCGGRLGLVESSWHEADADSISAGVLGCNCCVFPVVAGIPVMHLEPAAKAAFAAIEAGRHDAAIAEMFGFTDTETAQRFTRTAASADATFRDIVDALGSSFEGGYFLYRFSDPTYVVAEAVVHGIGAAMLRDGDRAIDLCGGSGHLARALLGVAPRATVIADLYFSKLWLARRFTAVGSEAVCCDGNSPMPFAPDSFRLAVCSDAFHYIWTKRLFANEMCRLVGGDGAAVITHAHSSNQWNPSAGMPLPPDGYRALFETLPARLYSERLLLDAIVAGPTVDLGEEHTREAVESDTALTIVASSRADVFATHQVGSALTPAGRFRLNPLYVIEQRARDVRLRLRFPSEDYEQEYGACRRYLPDEVIVDGDVIAALAAGELPAAAHDLVRRRVVLDLPLHYY